MKKLTFNLFTAALCLSPTVLSGDETTGTKPAEENKEATETKKPDQQIILECNDQMQFNQKELEIKAGETVKLTLKHTGQLPAIAMGHNFVLLAKDTNLMTWAVSASKPELRENDFIPTDEENKKAVLAHTKIIGGGETDAVTFSVKEAGEYEFLCSFPGHFALMKGKVIVK